MPDGKLVGKSVIVTGGGRGLGRAMALGLAAAGANVMITAARNPGELEEVVRAASALNGGKVVPCVADVTSPDDCRRVVANALDVFGGLHILVNNAGRGMKFISESFLEKPAPFWQADPAAWAMLVDTNVNGPFLMAREAVPHLLARGWGRIINVSMNFETMRRRGFSPYGPSKAAVESETIIWAADLAGTGVTVNSIAPGGATATGMIPAHMSEEVRKHLLDPSIMVAPLLWLASEESDGYSGGRYLATRWDASLAPSEAAQRARESAGWTG